MVGGGCLNLIFKYNSGVAGAVQTAYVYTIYLDYAAILTPIPPVATIYSSITIWLCAIKLYVFKSNSVFVRYRSRWLDELISTGTDDNDDDDDITSILSVYCHLLIDLFIILFFNKRFSYTIVRTFVSGPSLQ